MVADGDQQTTDTFLERLGDVFRSTDSHRVVGEACGLLGVHLSADQVYYTDVIAPRSEIRLTGGRPGGGCPNADARDSFGAFANALALLAPGPLLYIPDVERDPRVPGSAVLSSRALKARGVFASRVTRGGRLVAVLVVIIREPRRCARTDIAILNEVADRAWDSLQKARLEAELRECNETFHASFDVSAIGTLQWDPNSGPVRRVNGVCCGPVGEAYQRRLDPSIETRPHPDARVREDEPLRCSAEGAVDTYRTQAQYVRSDGDMVWVRVDAGPIRAADD